MRAHIQHIWSVFFAGKNTLRKGVYFFKKALTPETARTAFLPTIDRGNGFRSDNLRIIDETRLAEISKLVEFGRLSSGIFHDLLNPLTSILLAIESAHSSAAIKNTDDKEDLERALLASRRIKDFIGVARKGLDQHAPNDTFFPAREIRDVTRLLMYRCKRVGAAISLHLDDSLSMKGCSLAFFRVALNLVSNAIDSYEGTTNITKIVEVKLCSAGTKVLLSISDRGCGIPKTKLQTIFEPFYSTKQAKGLGIGLSTAKQLIEKLDGRILVESTVNKGTTFTIEFDKTPKNLVKKAALAAFSNDPLTEQTAQLQEA